MNKQNITQLNETQSFTGLDTSRAHKSRFCDMDPMWLHQDRENIFLDIYIYTRINPPYGRANKQINSINLFYMFNLLLSKVALTFIVFYNNFSYLF